MDRMLSKKQELREAVIALSSRCLTDSARWCAEMMVSAIEDEDTDSTSVRTEENDTDLMRLARIYIDSNEFKRCAYVLRDVKTKKEKFVRWYATYLAGEKRREEMTLEGEEKPVNDNLNDLRSELEKVIGDGVDADGFDYYLHGVVLKALHLPEDAVKSFCSSVQRFPLLWGSWTELLSLLNEREEIEGLDLPDHWMKEFFLANVSLEFQDHDDCEQRFENLANDFPQSMYIRNQTALALYNAREFDQSQAIFEQIVRDDPYRLEGIDTFSDILYVKEQRAKLSSLAHDCVKVDKYRPETCCVIGNYLSLRQQHEKAVHYFHRALKLNRSFLSAWTLMGHEYVEMKNTSAAVEAYRNAVDINPRDYRAWYGLGQTYELLNMPLYTLYYFRKAAALRPKDARMWCALGHCYEELRRDNDAVTCYERASSCKDHEGIAIKRLAALYKRLGKLEEAANGYIELLNRYNEEGEEINEEMGEALIFLAEFSFSRGDLDKSAEYCGQLLELPVPERVRANSILKKINAKRAQI